jgi:DNA-directed RNA polymerase specialized sigma24 family protein
LYLVDRLHKTVLGCQEGNPLAQRDLYEMFKTKMFGICLRYAGNHNDAEDIMQEGFIKVYEKIHQFGFKGAFEGWIRKIMVNTALEKYRMHFQTVIQDLTPRYRLVFNLYALEGYSHKEISEMLNITEGTSKSNLSRARVILQERVNKHYLKSVQTS